LLRPSLALQTPASPYGILPPQGSTPTVRPDNSRMPQSGCLRAAYKGHWLRQEHITRTPEQNGTIERFLRTLKKELVWLHCFIDFSHGRTEVMAWMRRYKAQRSHSTLRHLKPVSHRAYQLKRMA
jgi:putative transposase